MTAADFAWLLGVNAVPLFAAALGLAFLFADRLHGRIHADRMKTLREKRP